MICKLIALLHMRPFTNHLLSVCRTTKTNLYGMKIIITADRWWEFTAYWSLLIPSQCVCVLLSSWLSNVCACTCLCLMVRIWTDTYTHTTAMLTCAINLSSHQRLSGRNARQWATSQKVYVSHDLTDCVNTAGKLEGAALLLHLNKRLLLRITSPLKECRKYSSCTITWGVYVWDMYSTADRNMGGKAVSPSHRHRYKHFNNGEEEGFALKELGL